jgi:hypothetical protein
MMRILIGFVLGCLAYYYFPAEVEGIVEGAQEILHQGAVSAAEATSKAAEAVEPKSEFEKLLDKVPDPLKGK